MQNKNALIFGASGLIGSQILNQILEDESYIKVILLVRKNLDIRNPRVEQFVVDFDNPEQWTEYFNGVDVVFCAIGTTRSKTPDLVHYRKIDFDIPVHSIHLAEKYRVSNFMLVSSVGADANSKNFYLKIKGEVEEVLKKSQIEYKGIFQPSLLLGKRNENRFGEAFAQFFMSFFNFLVPMKFKAIQALDVAKAMVYASKKQDKGLRVYLYKDMVKSN